jgi:hypothetical protein
MSRKIAAFTAALSFLVGAPAAYGQTADQPHPHHKARHHKAHHGCQTNACEARVQARAARQTRLQAIRPYMGFLRSTGACESGTDGNLKHGLRAVDPWGKYRGRYQFDLSGWRGAGGYGDPIDAGWLEQAYRAVRWLQINGRQSWPNC